jgi:Signal recognition particle, alpha subunit, N-terminal
LVAAYQQVLSLPYVDTLLGMLRDEFAVVYKPNVFRYPQFDAVCTRLLQKVEKHAMTSKMRLQRHNGSAAANVRTPRPVLRRHGRVAGFRRASDTALVHGLRRSH